MSEFSDYLHELLERFGPIQVKRMFGGHGIWHQGLMIGLIQDDTLFLKSDALSAHWFESTGQRRFEYARRGQTMATSYFTAPPEMLENRDEAILWARRAYEAALRSRPAPRKPTKSVAKKATEKVTKKATKTVAKNVTKPATKAATKPATRRARR